MTTVPKLVAAALVAAATLAAGTAGAVSLTCSIAEEPAGKGAKGGSSATYTLGNATDAACFAGNDTNQIDTSFALFGRTGWLLADKNDDAISGDGTAPFTLVPVNGTTSGTWGLGSFAGLEQVVITLKAGNGFGAFLVDTAAGLTGTWATSKDLSHASVYYTPAPVPLPAAAWLLLGGLGALGAAARRKTARRKAA